MRPLKKALCVGLALCLLFSAAALAEPPAMPDGQPPQMTGGFSDGMGGPGMGGPGGGGSKPESYDALWSYSLNEELEGEEFESTGKDENAILVTGGNVTVSESSISRNSGDSTGGDSASFYGVGAAVLVTGGSVTVEDCEIETDAKGGAGVFAYGDGIAVVKDTDIVTEKDTSGGIHVAGGGTLYASELTVTTNGESSAAIRSDRGSGTMIVDGGSYTSNGSGSPAVYVTADIMIHDAQLMATGSEALCLEGLNSVRLYDCILSGDMPDLPQNDNTWTVILYQSMSGDAEIGKGRFEMENGTLIAGNGGVFYTTNTESEFVLSNVLIEAVEYGAYLLRCTGNTNQRGWGAPGANGAICTFTGIAQAMNGDVIWDSISNLRMYLTEGSVLSGAFVNDESCAGNGGDGTCTLIIDEDSAWIVTGNSTLTTLCCAGEIYDEAGNLVRIVSPEGIVFEEGTSEYTVTVRDYTETADISGAGVATEWNDDFEL
ncbi:MAG: hypothetical protein K5746_08400 [Clostridiales bacterium]|nr:hypothetical protein [Clostridiales bacterium]